MSEMTMIERIARAGAEAQGWRWHDDKQMFDRLASGQDTSRARDTWRKSARAMLAEMRDPTEAMQLAADNPPGLPTYASYWRNMIDSALSDTGE